MTSLTKIAFTPALLLAAMVPIATSAQAGEYDEPIVVTSQAELQEWQADTTRKLDRALANTREERFGSIASGIVQLTFSLDEDGRPANIELRDNSANWLSERSARAALRRVGDLSDVPVANPGDVQFLANIVFASDRAERRRLMEELERSERTRIAAGDVGYVVLGG